MHPVFRMPPRARIGIIRGMPAVRVTAALLALVVGAWFALGAVQSRDIDRAGAIASARGALTGRAAGQAASLLDDAGTLNPDRQVDLLRAELVARRGDLPGARAILVSVVHDEPQNIDAWAALARSSAGDPAAFRLAVARVRALAPPVGSD